jgi:pre-mRNA-processing factor 19
VFFPPLALRSLEVLTRTRTRTPLQSHTKRVTKALFHPTEDIAVTSSADQTVRVWRASSAEEVVVIKAHSKTVEDISLHPTGKFVLSCSADNTWALSDLRSGEVLFSVKDEDANAKGLNRIQVHPDGLILAVGTGSGVVRIWDLKQRAVLASFEGHQGPITALAFSENGYFLASGSEDSSVILWDLRHQKSVKNVSFDAGFEVNALDFDYSGTYLAVGGSDIRWGRSERE